MYVLDLLLLAFVIAQILNVHRLLRSERSMQPLENNQFLVEEVRLKNKVLLISLLSIISLGSLVIGYETMTITMLQKKIKQINEIEDTQTCLINLVTLMLPLGAIAGCYLSKRLNNYGENKLMKLTDLFVIISSLTLIGSLSIPLLCFRRFVIGLACGISSSIIPPFLISFAPIELTGLFGSFHQMFIALGMAISLFFGERLEGLSVPGLGNQKTYLILPVVYSVIRIPMLLLFEFNNLQTHYQRNQIQKLKENMKLFYNKIDYSYWMKTRVFVKSNSNDLQQAEGDSQTILGINKKMFTVAMYLLVLNYCTGFHGLFTFAKDLFLKVTTYNEGEAKVYLQWITNWQIISCIIGGYLINKYGRKRVMIIGGQMTAACLLSIAFISIFSPNLLYVMVFLQYCLVLGYSVSFFLIPLVYFGFLMHNLSDICAISWIVYIIGYIFQHMISSFSDTTRFIGYGMIAFYCLYKLDELMIQDLDKTRLFVLSEYNGSNISMDPYKPFQLTQNNDSNSMIESVDS